MSLINEVSKALEQSLNRVSTKALLPRAIPFSKDYFNEVKPIQSPITYVDGGNAQLLGGLSFSLQFIRVCSVLCEDKTRDIVREEFYALITTDVIAEEKVYVTKLFGSELCVPVIKENEVENVQAVVDVVRRYAEIMLAKKAKTPVVLDGNLQEDLPFLKEALDDASLSAVSKTCEIITDVGEPLVVALQKLGPMQAWSYTPLAEENTTLMVKLHSASKYVFKLEGNVTILPALAYHAKDPIFLGYPYGLVQADKLARVSNEEKRYLTLRFLHQCDEKHITQHLNTLNAHDVLDTI